VQHKSLRKEKFVGGGSVVSCQLSVVSCQLSVVSCQLSVVSGQWSVVSGQWSVVSGQWSVGSWQLAVRERDLGGSKIGFRRDEDPLNVYGGGQQQELSPLTTDN